jgi:hypothetical protein
MGNRFVMSAVKAVLELGGPKGRKVNESILFFLVPTAACL